MSAVFLKQYKGMCERGSTTLAGIDTAVRAKMLTAPEGDQVKTYWHSIYDIVDLAIAVEADRTQVVTWSAPNTVFHKVKVTRTAGAEVTELMANPMGDPVTFPAPADQGAVDAHVTAQVVATSENNGVEVSGTASVPAAATPPVDPDPTPTDPPTDPTDPPVDPETPTDPPADAPVDPEPAPN